MALPGRNTRLRTDVPLWLPVQRHKIIFISLRNEHVFLVGFCVLGNSTGLMVLSKLPSAARTPALF